MKKNNETRKEKQKGDEIKMVTYKKKAGRIGENLDKSGCKEGRNKRQTVRKCWYL